MIVAFDGCDSITVPSETALWFDRGVRCASLARNGYGRYAGGTGTATPLAPLGRELLAEFERLGIILDLTLPVAIQWPDGNCRRPVGSLDNVDRVIRITGYVNSDLDFTDQHLAINRTSHLILRRRQQNVSLPASQ